MENLRLFLKSLDPSAQSAFAASCGTSLGYLRKAISLGQKLGVALVIEIERASLGRVRCEDLRPDVDWGFLRGTAMASTQGAS